MTEKLRPAGLTYRAGDGTELEAILDGFASGDAGRVLISTDAFAQNFSESWIEYAKLHLLFQ